MRQIRELLRLHYEEGLSQRVLARSQRVARCTVERLLKRFSASGLGWPPDAGLTDEELERRLYGRHPHQGAAKPCMRPNYAAIAPQLARKGVTRRLLWTEYRDQQPDGIGYTVFCDELGAFLADRDLASRHDHVPGEKAYFDFAGLTLRYHDGDRVAAAHTFTAALGWSNAIFAYAYANETAESWLDGHHRAFVAFGGVTGIAVPNNPRALIAKAGFEPKLTAGYRDFARHCDVVVIPARVRKPKDKAAVEGAVKIVEMRILASARDRVFTSLAVLNDWLAEKLSALNAAPFQKRVGSRLSQLIEERRHLAPLPATRFEMATYLARKAARDYHVDVLRQYYSVPCAHVGQSVEVRLTRTHFEVLLRDQRIALHRRASSSQRFITDPEYMPAHHRACADPKIQHRATAVGSGTVAFIEGLFAKRRHPEQAIRSAQGMLGLVRDQGAPALEAACMRACALDTIGYEHLRRLLLSARAQLPLPLPPQSHEHVRGGDYLRASYLEIDHAA